MPGVKAILTADDLPAVVEGADLGEGIIASKLSERGLTMEPLYEGEPVLAVAAVDEHTAAEAIEKIQIDFEPLPFVVDPLESLRPGSPNARTDGNVWVRPAPTSAPANPQVKELKWTEEHFSTAKAEELPLGQHTDEWKVGDVEAGFTQADLVLDETFVGPNTSHEPLETRTAMAYWQNGKLYMHCSTQSTMRTIAAVARWVGIDRENVVIISEYTGGGFGSKGSSSVFTCVAALLSKKANAPVMMRITRDDEYYIGRARPALHSRVKVGFRKDGRITALDGFVIVDNGPYDVVNDSRSAGDHVSLSYQPLAMRWRMVTVLTNTPPRGAQRAPGGFQANALMEPILAKASRKLGIDQVAIHRINAPEGKAPFGALTPRGAQGFVTSANLKDALDKGAELFRWNERKARGPQKNGSLVRGLGVGVSAYSAGTLGFDGLLIIKPDGRLAVQSGIGNLGTGSVFDVHRVAAEVLDIAWDKVDITWGNTSKYVPNTCGQGGSQTTHAMTRAAYAAATDAVKKLQELAAETFGGKPEDYRVANETVSGRGRSMTFAQAAAKAIELGGTFDGHELPKDINAFTKTSATALAGHGLMGVAKDTYGRNGTSKSYVAGFADVEVDIETGVYRILDFLAVADVGTVLHSRNLGGQILGGVMLGSVTPAVRSGCMFGSRGVGESPVGAGFSAVVNAISDAVGDEIFRRAPVTPDMILLALEHGRPMHDPLTANV